MKGCSCWSDVDQPCSLDLELLHSETECGVRGCRLFLLHGRHDPPAAPSSAVRPPESRLTLLPTKELRPPSAVPTERPCPLGSGGPRNPALGSCRSPPVGSAPWSWHAELLNTALLSSPLRWPRGAPPREGRLGEEPHSTPTFPPADPYPAFSGGSSGMHLTHGPCATTRHW